MSVALMGSEKNAMLHLTLTFPTLTLSEGRRAMYALERVVAKYQYAKNWPL